MKKLNSGAIVNIVSNVVAAARLENAAYAAAKSGLLSLTQVAALELACHNIRVNAVSPGTTKTKLLESYSDDMLNGILKGDLERFRIGIPLKKFATPEDHANVVAFLVNESSGHITGQNIFVDGGQTLA
jgi:2,3-dihydro-2,3-dihydroxybenzoate dehydrogenase